MWIEVSNDDELFLRKQYESTATSCFDFVGVEEMDAVIIFAGLVGGGLIGCMYMMLRVSSTWFRSCSHYDNDWR